MHTVANRAPEQKKLVELLLAIKSYENTSCQTNELVTYIEEELKQFMEEGTEKVKNKPL
ncbi:hypothetical protein [Bacillus solitudinis]|uniref:hypothetical protein n=1 Tax=Bacillus solitudinis TaxID=2014074 RepID=UPI0012FDAB43|nr:hypothetical protein [Bacillus solitudinis]